MSEGAPQPTALAAFLAWPAPVGAGAASAGPQRCLGGDGVRATAIAAVLCLLLAAVGMALPIALGVQGAGVDLRSHLSLICHLI